MTPSLGAPAVGEMAPFSLPPVEHRGLSSGLRTSLVAAGSIPKAHVRLVLDLGTVHHGESAGWLPRLLGDYLKEGTGDLDGAALADAVARMGGRLAVNVEDDTTTVSAAVLAEFAPDLVHLLATVVREPAFPASEEHRLKADLARRLDLAKAQPGALATAAFRDALYDRHPYGRYLTTRDVIDGFSAAAVRSIFKAYAGPSKAHLYVGGMFDAPAVLEAAETAFDGWADGDAVPVAAATPSSARAIHLVDRPGAEQSTLSIGRPVPDPTDDDYVALAVTNSLLGGSFYSRITLNIREDKGYTYSPRSQLVTHPGVAHWVELADVTTAVTGASLKEIFGEIERLRSEPPADDELEGIKNYVTGTYVLRHATPGGILDQLEFLDLHGLDERWAAAYVDRVIEIDGAEVQRIAAAHLPPDDMTIAIVGDASAIREQIEPFGEIVEAKVVGS
jgi:predicted Zn-dependent peptidase